MDTVQQLDRFDRSASGNIDAGVLFAQALTRRPGVNQLYNTALLNRSLYGLLGLPIGITWLVVFSVSLSLSLGLLVILVGFVLLALTLRMAGAAAFFERRVLFDLLDVEIEPPQRLRRESGNLLVRTLRDGSYWRELSFLLARFPLGVTGFVVTILIWAFPMWALSTVFWGWWVFGSWTLLIVLFGLASLVIGPLVLIALTEVEIYLARALLGPSQSHLTERARVVQHSRDRSVESAEAERRRIERDLHDGAQARLATVALDLGRAKRRLEQGGTNDEVGAIIDSAHTDAKAAIVELRDLARGIHPAVLTDRGLDAALSEVVARSRVPVHLDVRLARRPTAPIESAAYFAVCELMANIDRHSSATNAWVTVRGTNETLTIDVSDDGVGGVDAVLGTGVTGLHDRVTAVDGSMSIHSPLGGGTTALIELPIA